jgi:hypothetical protein
MNIHTSIVKQPRSWLIGIVSLTLAASCSGNPVSLSQNEMAAQEVQVTSPEDSASTASGERDRLVNIPTPGVQRSPQLVKNASLTLELANVDEAIASIAEILTRYQGDLLQLSDQESQSAMPRQVTLQLRVPQGNLDAVLDALRALGTVENQSITAEDVSNQLVDLQARIRNLRKSEDSLLEIMERSGSIAEVLEVSRELSTIREAIERHEAQRQTLQNRVTYSTVSLTLISTQQPTPEASPVGQTLSQTWQAATSSVRTLSVSLLRLSLWLLAFSPYIGLLAIAGWAGRRYWHSHRRANDPVDSN